MTSTLMLQEFMTKEILIDTDDEDFTCVVAEITVVVQTELTLRLRHTSPAVLISWMA